MLFKLFRKKEKIQQEYIELITKIIKSPLWDGSDEQIKKCLPVDVSERTIAYVKEHINDNSESK